MGRLARAVAAAALALATNAGVARALDAYGAAGVGYERSDTASPGSSASVPAWDFAGNLQLNGAPFRPGLLRWNAGGEYRHQRTLYSEGQGRTNAILYNAGADLFASSPLGISLFTSRSRLDFTTDLAARETGTSFVSTRGARASLTLENWPLVRAGFVASDSDNEAFGGQRTETGLRQVDLSASQVVGALRYSAAYDSGWNTGTFASTNYRSHQLMFDSTLALSPDLDVLLSDRYFLRLPTVVAPTNPRLDDNGFSGSVRWRPVQRVTATGSYVAQRSVAEIPGSADRQGLSDTVNTTADYRVTPRLTLSGNLGASRNEQRLGGTSLRVSNESVGTGARWEDRTDAFWYGLSGTAAVALVQASNRDDSGLGRLLGAGASIGTSRDRWSTSLGYDVNQTRDVGSVVGNSFSQALNGYSEYARRRSERLRLTAQLAQGRRDSPLFGEARNRSATAGLSYFWQRYMAQLAGGYSEGVSMTAPNPLGGVILPIELSQRSRYANLTASGPLTESLQLTGLVRTLWADIPGRPRQQETGLSLVASYRVGAFTLSAEERYSRTHASDVSTSANLILVRATRSFGATF